MISSKPKSHLIQALDLVQRQPQENSEKTANLTATVLKMRIVTNSVVSVYRAALLDGSGQAVNTVKLYCVICFRDDIPDHVSAIITIATSL